MKLANVLIASIALGLCGLGPNQTSQALAAVPEGSDELPPVPKWLVDFMTDQLTGWSCSCSEVGEGKTVFAGFKYDDKMEVDDRHSYRLVNFSNKEISVVLSMTSVTTGEDLGKTEVTLAPQSVRVVSTVFWIPEDATSDIVRTSVKYTLPLDATEAGSGGGLGYLLGVRRNHFYEQPGRLPQRNTGDLKCGFDGCTDFIKDGGIGGCSGPSFQDCT